VNFKKIGERVGYEADIAAGSHGIIFWMMLSAGERAPFLAFGKKFHQI